MPTLNAGSSYDQYMGAGMSVRIQTNHNQFGRIYFIAANDEEAPPSGLARSFGPLAVDQTFGPWGIGGTVYIENDAGSSGALTYTVVSEPATSPTFATVAATNVNTSNLTLTTAYVQTGGTFGCTGNGNKSLTASGNFTVTLGAIGTNNTTLTRLNNLTVVSTDSSGTPGNATNNNLSGRAAFAAAASTVVITNSQVTAASKVFVSLTGTADATLKYVTVTAGAGSFTVTGNAAATATTVFDYLVVN